jgi:uncharacterized membrane protein
MSLYTVIRHPHVHTRRERHPSRLADAQTGFNGELAAWITTRIGSMWTVYVCLLITAIWMVLGAKQVLGFDPYPYPFLLFLGNVVQLLLIFIILLGQQVLGRTADMRAAHTYEDTEAILVDCEQIQNHLIAQDDHLARCTELLAEEQETLARAAVRIEAPPTMDDEYVGFNGRLAAWLTNRAGTMTAFYVALFVQIGWIIAGEAIGFDPYPFAFLLFLSSLLQLLLMFIIMVGQQAIGKTTDKRAVQTYLDAEAVLHACERLQAHLRAQDLAIMHIVQHMEECRSQEARHPGPLIRPDRPNLREAPASS